MRLETHADLVDALNKPGFLVVKKRSVGRSRIHRTSCRSLWFKKDVGELDMILGRGKVKHEYHYCKTWDDAVKTWRNSIGERELQPCSICKPRPIA